MGSDPEPPPSVGSEPPPLVGSEPEPLPSGFEPEPEPESPPSELELGPELDPAPGVQVGTLLMKKSVESGPLLKVLEGDIELDELDGPLVPDSEAPPESELPEPESWSPRFLYK